MDNIGGEMNITIVDDNRELTHILEESLKNYKSDWDIYSFNTGRDAIESIPTTVPDIIFIDISLPDMSGLEILSAVKDIDKDIQAIIMSAYPTVDNIITAMRLGALDFIKKPVHMKHILNALDNASEKRHTLLDSRTAVANLLTKKDFEEEIEGMFSIMDKTGIINDFVRCARRIRTKNEFIKYTINYFSNIINSKSIYFYSIINNKAIRYNTIDPHNDINADNTVKNIIIDASSTAILKLSKSEIIIRIDSENNVKGFIYIKRPYAFKYKEIDILMILTMQVASHLSNIDLIKKTDINTNSMILSFTSLSDCYNSKTRKMFDIGMRLSVDFGYFLSCSVEEITQLRHASFIYYYIKATEGGNNDLDQIFLNISRNIEILSRDYPLDNFKNRISELTEHIVHIEKIMNIVKNICIFQVNDNSRKSSSKDSPFLSRILSIINTFTAYYVLDCNTNKKDILNVIEQMYRAKNDCIEIDLMHKFEDFIRQYKIGAQLMLEKETPQ